MIVNFSVSTILERRDPDIFDLSWKEIVEPALLRPLVGPSLYEIAIQTVYRDYATLRCQPKFLLNKILNRLWDGFPTQLLKDLLSDR